MLGLFSEIGLRISLLWHLSKLEPLVWNKVDWSWSPSAVTEFMTWVLPFSFLNLSNIVCETEMRTLTCGMVVCLLGKTASENSL